MTLLGKPQRIAVVRMLSGLGDFLCAVPALRALRSALPDARITVIGLPAVRGLVQRFRRYVDDLGEFPGFPGLPETVPNLGEIPQFIKTMQRRHFDLALQMHGNGIVTNPLTVLLGARDTAGFFLPGQFCPDPDRFIPYPDGGHEIIKLLTLTEHLGVPTCGPSLEFPLRKEDRQALRAIKEARTLWPGGYVCIHAGAKDGARRWPADRFAVIANEMTGRGMRVVLTGTAEETAVIASVTKGTKKEHINLGGRTSLGALAVLLSHARLLVCNDTGVSHLAAALRVPSVVIFTGSDPVRWAPLDRELHRPVVCPLPGAAAGTPAAEAGPDKGAAVADGTPAATNGNAAVDAPSPVADGREQIPRLAPPSVADVLREVDAVLYREEPYVLPPLHAYYPGPGSFA